MVDKVLQKQLESFGYNAIKEEASPLSKRKRLSQQRVDLTKTVVKELMSTVHGRNWIYNYLDECQIFTTTFVVGKPDLSDFLSGIQSVGQRLLSDIMLAAPDQFYLMNQEAGSRALGESNIPDDQDAS